ncbi:hypothetical protein [Janthinobacterium sp.]|uniref:hypothetical protein n=1 Tax=Janthinobacterium sp. TaxID=1871054 RepID=UPI00258AB984|nr:hypothetical protein [Janthinobacterium sp.]MCX7289505.1 hypothetical protein [Janthinobacterium sp.]
MEAYDELIELLDQLEVAIYDAVNAFIVLKEYEDVWEYDELNEYELLIILPS